jgi:hypothetical protein
MANENDLELKFGADASGAVEGGEQAASAVKAVGASVQALIDTLLILGGSATGSFRQIRTGAAEAAEGVKGVSESVTAMREAISGIGEALIAAFAVEQIAHFVEKMAEASEVALHTAMTFGLTVGEVQRMGAEATLAGVPAEALATAMQRLDKAFATAKQGGKQQAAAFKEMGVDIQGSYTQTELLKNALAGLSTMDAGPAKVAAAMAVFGRNIQAIGPLLNMTAEQIAENSRLVTEYGAVNEEAALKGAALAEGMNQNKVAGMGLKLALTDALAPAMTEVVDGLNGMIRGFVASYNAGGTAKTVMDAVVWSFKAVADMVGLFGTVADYVFKQVDGAVWVFQAAIVGVADAVFGASQMMIDALKTFGDIAKDVFTLNWGAIAADWRAGNQRVAADVVATSKKMGEDAGKAYAKGVAEWASSDKDVENYEAWSKRLYAGKAKAKGPKEGTGTTADDPSKQKHAAGGLPPGDSALQKWEAELQDKKLADQNFWNDDLTGERDFWLEKLGILQAQSGGTKAEINQRAAEIRSIRQKIFADDKALTTQARDFDLASLSAVTKEQADTEKTRYQLVKDGLAARTQAAQQAQRRGEISPEEELALLKQVNDEMVVNEKAKVDKIYEIDLAGIKAKEALYYNDPVNLAKVQAQELILARGHQDALTLIDAKGAQDRKRLEELAATQAEAIWRQRLGPIATSFGQTIQGLINQTQTWRGAMFAVLSSVENAAFSAAERIATNWLVHEAMKTTASQSHGLLRQALVAVEALFGIGQQKTAAVANIGASAAAAGAAGVASAAAIPLTGWEIAPGAGALDYGAAMSYAPLVAASGGYDIPAGFNPVVQAHQEEMILPARIANPLRQMIAANHNTSGSSPAANDSGGAGGGDTHHHWNISAVDAHSFERLLMQNPRALERAATKATRSMLVPQ